MKQRGYSGSTPADQMPPPARIPSSFVRPPARPLRDLGPAYVEVTEEPRLLGVRRWKILIHDGICVYGPGYGGMPHGWTSYGSRERAERKAGRKLAAYLADERRRAAAEAGASRFTEEDLRRG